MFDPNEYELLDFSCGEKLERFGETIVRRQTPSIPTTGKLMAQPDSPTQLRYRRAEGDPTGQWSGNVDHRWCTRHHGVNFQLKATPTGQVGIFPEQASNWDWIRNSSLEFLGLKAINLFGYTGGTTLALAKAGAEVTHVDAAKTAVSWARENAAASQLQEHPIRWIAEDAMRFLERELKRGKTYDIFVADPPSFGRGPSGETWKLERDLQKLLTNAALLTNNQAKMVIISCHTPSYDAQRLGRQLSQAWGLPNRQIESGTLELRTSAGRSLSCGEFARWQLPTANQE